MQLSKIIAGGHGISIASHCLCGAVRTIVQIRGPM